MTAARLLVVDDEPDLRTLYELTLLREGYEIDSAGSVAEALELLQAGSYSAVITDMKLPDGSGLALLRWLEQAGRPEKALVITAFGSAENAVEALKAGAYDYLTKPVDLRQFRLVVASALGRVAPEPAPVVKDAAPAPAAATALRLVGESPAICAVRSLIDKVARSMAPVLVQGESGTGKELVARAIHEHGVRAKQRFVAVNCGAIPENLLEAEFFGYRKGAFTGANEDREGFFQAADGGTLFLDEIGDMPLALQARLLRALQERSVTPLGSTKSIAVDIAVVGATHRNLREMIAAQTFREDLYYRLNGLALRLPALRERTDIEAIVRRILQAERPHDTPDLSPQVLAMFRRYQWPGNIRQLANVLRTAAVMSAGERLVTTAHLSDDFLEDIQRAVGSAMPVVAPVPAPAPMPMAPAWPAYEAAPALPAPQPAFVAAEPATARTLGQAEIDMIRATLDAVGGNISLASKQLGISRNTIYRKLRWNAPATE